MHLLGPHSSAPWNALAYSTQHCTLLEEETLHGRPPGLGSDTGLMKGKVVQG